MDTVIIAQKVAKDNVLKYNEKDSFFDFTVFMPESLERKGEYEKKICDEGGTLLLLLISDSAKYEQEKNNLRNLVEPQEGIDPTDVTEQRRAFIDFYYPGWTVEDVRFLLSYLEEYEVKARALREQYSGNITEVADALMNLLS